MPHLRFCTNSLLLFAMLSVNALHAGGFDNTSKHFGIIFDSANHPNEFRLDYHAVYPDIHGFAEEGLGSANNRRSVDNLVGNYQHHQIALRVKLNQAVSCALRYDQPFRTDVRYRDDTLSYQADPLDPGSQIYAAIDSLYDSQALTMACRYTWQDDKQRFHVFFGPKHQQINGAFSSDLTSFDLGQADNLNVYLDGHSEWGHIVGVGYEIPSIAARLALTYHSEIKYDLDGTSFTPAPDFSQRIKAPARGKTRTPQAVNLSMQSGISEGWLIFSGITWSEWGKVKKIDVQDGVGNPGLTLFSNDTLDATLGIAHALNEQTHVGFSYSTGIKLGDDTNPPGIDGPDMRNPLGDTHTFSVGGAYSFSKQISVDLIFNTIVLERKRILEQRYYGDVFFADMARSTAYSVSLGLSWFFDK